MHSRAAQDTIIVGPGTNEKGVRSPADCRQHLPSPRHLYKRHAVDWSYIICLTMAVLSILTIFTLSFISLTKLPYFSSPIPVLKSILNLLYPGVISCLIVWSFDITTIQNRFTFGQILLIFFLEKWFWTEIFKLIRLNLLFIKSSKVGYHWKENYKES